MAGVSQRKMAPSSAARAAAACCACFALISTAAADLLPRQTAAPTTAAPLPEITAITDCHPHDTDLYCFVGATEYLVETTLTATNDYPKSFTDCHPHGSELYCVGPDGSDVGVDVPSTGGESGGEESGHGESGHDHGGESESSGDPDEVHCHSHAGVEHCVDGNGQTVDQGCAAPTRDYNVGLRVGLLFVILATSALGVFVPILLRQWMPRKLTTVFTVMKQFGTGIIISTAFVHLYTHAALMFGSKCIGSLGYEGITSAIVMAGIFLSFIVEYAGQRVVLAKTKAAASLSLEERSKAMLSTEIVNILVMETGIVFHSILIGLTLVVAADSSFKVLFIVILFHQMFEGIALGSRIADLGSSTAHAIAHLHSPQAASRDFSQESDKAVQPVEDTSAVSSTAPSEYTHVPLIRKIGLAAVFAFITPIGMAIGIGVLDQFNGNDRSTLLTIGTLDALSAGILVWVGVVEMWAGDWMVGSHGHPAQLADANILTVILAGLGLVSGLVVMSVLGKWA
ncbi:Zinc-regulated transporter 1 [Paramyrothecium foliicola]|nr:Zinc-regulated transporter 1 [Paramyrothecium foliicola]